MLKQKAGLISHTMKVVSDAQVDTSFSVFCWFSLPLVLRIISVLAFHKTCWDNDLQVSAEVFQLGQCK
jgi:hypothetical protein